jgi:membrane associated rhomboid family serine protease
MLFFPFKADIRLSRIPFITILISLACLVIYWQQSASENNFANYANTFCEQEKGRIHKIVMAKVADSDKEHYAEICSAVYSAVYFNKDSKATIKEISQTKKSFSTKSLEKTHKYINVYITKKYELFKVKAPSNLTKKLYYEPSSFNVLKMISSALSHGSWSHVIGNLFFFFAFAATIEIILGSLIFPLVIIVLAIGTNLVYSISTFAAVDALPTLGLSGVVMGMMGMFAYFIPTAKIRCFFWFLIWVKRFGVSAWLLAMWYFGWDVYELYQSDTAGGVNLIAHVSGFIEGFLIGLIFFRWRKVEVNSELKSNSDKEQLSQAMN